MSRILHVVPPYRQGPQGAHGVGGVTSASHALAALCPESELAQAYAPGADLVHLHHALAWDEALLAPMAPPWVKTIHVLHRRQNRLREFSEETRSSLAQAAIVRHAQQLTVATHAAQEMLLEDYAELPELASRLRVIPLLPPPLRVQSTPSETPSVLFVGRFDGLKGTDLLVGTCVELLRAHPSVEIRIAGGLPDHGKAERRWLKRLRENLTDEALTRVHFLGWLSPEALHDEMGRTWLFIAPSRLETCGLAVLEALAGQTPILASDIAAHRELIGPAGLLVELNSQAFAEAALAHLAQPTPLWTLALQGHQRVPDPAEVERQWLLFWRENR